MYKIFYINLEKSIDRKKEMEKQFNDLSYNFIRINAVNGNLINNVNRGIINNINYEVKVKKFFIKTQLGCLLSHIKTFFKIKEENIDIGIICEDDISFEYINKWDDNLNTIIKEAPNDWEIIKLHSSCIKTINYLLNFYKKKIKYLDNNYIKNKKLENSSTGIYIINKKYIEKFMKKYYVKNTLKLFGKYLAADIFLFNDFRVYNYTKPLFVTKNFKSIIMNKINPYDVKSNNLIHNYYKCV